MPLLNMTPEQIDRLKEQLNVFDSRSASRYLLYGGALVGLMPKPKSLWWLDSIATASMAAGGWAGFGSDYGVFPYKNEIRPHPWAIIKAMFNPKSKDRWKHARSAIAHLAFAIWALRRQRKFRRKAMSLT